jgi:uracil-DNA glycosylase
MFLVKVNIMSASTKLSLNILKDNIDQTWSLERIAQERPPRTWEAVFEDAKPELHDISTILDEQERTFGNYYPEKCNIFSAFSYTPLTNVKIVIIGQDPYHQTISHNNRTVPRAVGLSFSVRKGDSIPSSLSNIYTELESTVRGFTKPNHGDLTDWAKQGVLLLNMCLTVRPNQPGSHGDIWLGFMDKVFKAIATVNPYCIYMLWGRQAQKLKPMLGERSIILEAAHPSGFSAKRGFFGCNHFNLSNEYLIKQGKIGINWRLNGLHDVEQPKINTKDTSERNLVPINSYTINVGVPTILGISNSVSHTKVQQTLVPPLQIIPITKNLSQEKHNVLPNSEIEEQTSNNVPVIPKIIFGSTQKKVVNNDYPILLKELPNIPFPL